MDLIEIIMSVEGPHPVLGTLEMAVVALIKITIIGLNRD